MTKSNSYCDRCGAKIQTEKGYYGTVFKIRFEENRTTKIFLFPHGDGYYMEKDLCPDCRDSFYRWYNECGNKIEF